MFSLYVFAIQQKFDIRGITLSFHILVVSFLLKLLSIIKKFQYKVIKSFNLLASSSTAFNFKPKSKSSLYKTQE